MPATTPSDFGKEYSLFSLVDGDCAVILRSSYHMSSAQAIWSGFWAPSNMILSFANHIGSQAERPPPISKLLSFFAGRRIMSMVFQDKEFSL
jgi:hypothetical protein